MKQHRKTLNRRKRSSAPILVSGAVLALAMVFPASGASSRFDGPHAQSWRSDRSASSCERPSRRPAYRPQRRDIAGTLRIDGVRFTIPVRNSTAYIAGAFRECGYRAGQFRSKGHATVHVRGNPRIRWGAQCREVRISRGCGSVEIAIRESVRGRHDHGRNRGRGRDRGRGSR